MRKIVTIMEKKNFDTLSEAVNALTKAGYEEQFKAEENRIIGLNSKKEYKPDELKIYKVFRFDGMTNPADESEVFALKANDGTKGTLVMSYSSENDQNADLIKKLEFLDS